MNVAVDSNVVAYLVLGTMPRAGGIRTLLEKCDRIFAPDLLISEITNVMWMAIKNKVLSFEDGIERIESACRLITDTVPVTHLWTTALKLSVEYDHPVYDTLFIALALKEDIPLITFDKKLLAKFPGITKGIELRK